MINLSLAARVPMTFDDAITAHAEWKTRLVRYMEHHDGSLSPRAIEDDHACKLGIWIYGPAVKYKNLPEYHQLVTDHVAFHRQAALIVQKINNGEPVSTRDVTHPDSPYIIASRNIVSSILGMRRKIGDVVLDAEAPPPQPVGLAEEDKSVSFLKIASANPVVTRIVLESANQAAQEIALLIKTYNNSPTAPALVDVIRESLLVSISGTLMRIQDQTTLRSTGGDGSA